MARTGRKLAWKRIVKTSEHWLPPNRFEVLVSLAPNGSYPCLTVTYGAGFILFIRIGVFGFPKEQAYA
jgi:hypothetical protein